MTTTVFVKNGNMCHECNKNLPFDKVFIVGARSGSLQKLVGDYKYFSQYEGAKQIASLLNQILPEDLPSDLAIVPLTTIPKHVRQRGFDHMNLVAKNLAKIRKLRVCSILRRTNNLSQHVASGSQRRENAKSAFYVSQSTAVPKIILLIDDIYTTGATTQAAAKLLKERGANQIWLAVAARQIES